MVTKKTSSSAKKTAPKKASAKTTTQRKAANKVDYYPNRVPLLAAVAGVSLLMLIALLVVL